MLQYIIKYSIYVVQWIETNIFASQFVCKVSNQSENNTKWTHTHTPRFKRYNISYTNSGSLNSTSRWRLYEIQLVELFGFFVGRSQTKTLQQNALHIFEKKNYALRVSQFGGSCSIGVSNTKSSGNKACALGYINLYDCLMVTSAAPAMSPISVG